MAKRQRYDSKAIQKQYEPVTLPFRDIVTPCHIPDSASDARARSPNLNLHLGYYSLGPMPPKGSTKKRTTTEDGSATATPTLAEQFSYLHQPRPFKNPNYTKNVNRRTKNLKTVLTQERERERVERERIRQEREEHMDVDGQPQEQTADEDLPTYSSIEAPPSLLPPGRYCDITGLEGPYTDPATSLRFHDKSIYELIKNLSATAAKDYLAARGVNPIVK